MEIGQALRRLGSEVTIVDQNKNILLHDDSEVTNVLFEQLKNEGIKFILDAQVAEFKSATEAAIKKHNGEIHQQSFDAVFVAVGRTFELSPLQLERAGIHVKNDRIVANQYLRTTNEHVFVCGDIAGSRYGCIFSSFYSWSTE